MITFRDGPAAAVGSLLLRRAPVYLRVVVDETDGKVDALDQLEDTPGPSERIYVYRRVGGISASHICYRGRNKHRSGWYAVAEYEHVPEIDGESVRETEAWREWCHGQPEARPKAEALGA